MPEVREQPSPGATVLRRSVAVVVLLLLSGFTGVFVSFPEARGALVKENGILQTATAVVFLVAAIGAAVAIRSGRLVPKIYWVIPAFGFLGFAGEIRFATRFVRIAPFSVGGKEVDSFHDLFEAAVGVATDAGIRPIHVLVLLAVGAIVIGAYAGRGRLEAVIAWLARHAPMRMAMLAVGVLFIGLGLDLVGHGSTVAFIEETIELTAAALLAMAAVSIAERHSAVVSWRRFDLDLTSANRH